ncbi:DUF4158 domain-containing protein [Nocardiopsis dassonvillei]|uniref:DUF4158 domain-containing protein n=1 Tax=Nocardiopsis dassonvillei TaxID=2014 RepID=UPI0020108F07|nr:DUF4158 domain-containing protein [Nocardiopsis dassonvillei]MCK9868833.1 DUF4158 domain-containing protein [Nocardiopsis dassonvillei]
MSRSPATPASPPSSRRATWNSSSVSPHALELATGKRTPTTRLGWAVQRGTVRMLGVFQPDHPTRVPERAVAFVADQLDVDPGRLEEYRTRAQTAYEHAWQIRDAFGYREFAAGEEDLRAYLAARVWAGEEGPKALFDRSVLYLLEHQTLLPGLTVLSRLVSGVRKAENALLHQVVAKRIPHPVRAEPGTLLQIPDQARFSELERLRTEPDRVSSPGLVQALDRTSQIAGIGAGKVQVDDVPQATLLATVRHLETASVDEALDVLIHTPQATGSRVVSLSEVWNAIEEVVPREKLMETVKTITQRTLANHIRDLGIPAQAARTAATRACRSRIPTGQRPVPDSGAPGRR